MKPSPRSRKEIGNVMTRIATRPAPTRSPSRRTSSRPMIAIPNVRPHAAIGPQKYRKIQTRKTIPPSKPPASEAS